jgi:four helix bundle protein
MDLAVDVYKATENFPSEEKFGFTSQVCKSAVSIPSNIAEGAGRNSKKEFAHFLGVSNGPSYELKTQALISERLSLIQKETVRSLVERINELQKMNYGLQASLSK